MQRISFTPDREVKLFDKVCRVESVSDQEVVLVRPSGARSTYSLHTLLAHSYAGNLKSCPQTKARRAGEVMLKPRRSGALLLDLSAKQREAARLRWRLLQSIGDDVPIRRGDKQLEAFVEEAAKDLGMPRAPSLPALIRWRRELSRGGHSPQSLAPRYDRRGGKGQLRFDAEVKRELDAVIENFYLTPDGESAKAAYDIFEARLLEQNRWRAAADQLKIPSYSTFLRRIYQYDAYDITAAREGARAAGIKYRHSSLNSELHGFNECWEVDHAKMDILIVDPRSSQVVARPWLTVMIEHRTRSIMGFHISMGGGSTQSVLSCLRHSIRPKTYLKELSPEVQGEWPCFGMPLVVKCDNGPEFHSHTLKAVGEELGIEFIFCPTKKPWFKARVERFFGTLTRGLLQRLPGATGHTTKARKDVGDANLPVIDLQLLMRLLHVWIVDEYMVANHRGIK